MPCFVADDLLGIRLSHLLSQSHLSFGTGFGRQPGLEGLLVFGTEGKRIETPWRLLWS